MSEPLCTEKKTRRQEQTEERREQLLQVALEVFSEKGFRAATIKDIARAAGVADGLLAHHFGNKAGLVRAVVERFCMNEEMSEALQGLQGRSVRETLYGMGRAYLDVMSRHRPYMTLVISEAIRDPEVAAVSGQLMAEGLAGARAYLEAQAAAGQLRPHDSEVVIRTLQSATLWFFLMNERLAPAMPPLDADRFLRVMTDAILDGIAAPDSRP